MAFNAKKFIERAVAEIKGQVGEGNAICAMSGGVDSSVLAVLGEMALGGRMTAVFVDTGLMRLDEPKNVADMAKSVKMKLISLDEGKRYFTALSGVADPEKKRHIIGELFVDIFSEKAKEKSAKFLLQGTIAPDRIESGATGGDKIKGHHNLHPKLKQIFGDNVCEPLKDLYKHEVRQVARELGLPPALSERQPFPGPGLAVRIVGEITQEKAEIVKKACAIVEEEIEKASEAKKIERPWQYFAALLPTKTVGVRGDERAYQYTMVVRSVRSLDAMTANFSHLPPELLERISSRITNEIREVGRVFYDITNKPPSTIEME